MSALGDRSVDDEALGLVRAAFSHARAGEAAELASLLDRGVPPDVCNEKGDSLLMLASYNGHVEATRVLLERGADPELANGRGQTPLAGVAFKGDESMAALLLDSRAAVDGCGPDGKTPLMFAAMFDRVEIIELLLCRGADPERADASGAGALALARGRGASRALARLERAALPAARGGVISSP